MTRTPPTVVENDPEAHTRELVAAYEAMTGRTLYPAQVERLQIDLMVYNGGLLRAAMQDAAVQNLARHARAPMLIEWGDQIGVDRLPAASARTTLRVTLTAVDVTDTVIPAGFRVRAKDTDTLFLTDAPLTIAAGATEGTVGATAARTGPAANGFLAGEVATPLDPSARIASVANITVTTGGADIEDIERYRARVMQAPRGLSADGPDGAYRSRVRAAGVDVADVGVYGPEDRTLADRRRGEVDVYVLAATGIPSPELLTAVAGALTPGIARPITDRVNILPAMPVDYTIAVELTLLRGTDQTEAEAEALAALARLADAWAGALAADIVVSKIIAVAQTVRGVHAVAVPSPLADISLDRRQFARLAGPIAVVTTGVADG